MILQPDKLARALNNPDLKPAYLVFGDEPLQLMESLDAIRHALRAQGANERIVLEVERGFDWDELAISASGMSLFAEKRIVEVRLGDRKPDKKGTAHIESMLSGPAGEDTLLLSANKLDRKSMNAKWFKAFEKHGAVVQCRQLSGRALESWIVRRAKTKNIEIEAQVAELIAARAEGNMLAAAQELDKIALMTNTGSVDTALAMKSITDSARYDVFKLIDSILAGQASQAIRMLRGLREEGTEPIVVNWALNKELRGLCAMRLDMEAGSSVSAATTKAGVWRSRLNIIEKVLSAHSAGLLREQFLSTINIDRMIKGAMAGDPWNEIESVCVALAR